MELQFEGYVAPKSRSTLSALATEAFVPRAIDVVAPASLRDLFLRSVLIGAEEQLTTKSMDDPRCEAHDGIALAVFDCRNLWSSPSPDASLHQIERNMLVSVEIENRGAEPAFVKIALRDKIRFPPREAPLPSDIFPVCDREPYNKRHGHEREYIMAFQIRTVRKEVGRETWIVSNPAKVKCDPHSLIVPSKVAADFVLLDIFVEGKSCLKKRIEPPISCSRFSELVNRGGECLHLPTIERGGTVSLLVRRVETSQENFTAALIAGTSDDEGPDGRIPQLDDAPNVEK